jgi:ADP-ribosylglycohydrolase
VLSTGESGVEFDTRQHQQFLRRQLLAMNGIIALTNAERSLEGLSVGDAFGELFFRLSPNQTSAADLPSGPWPWTDDTHMALSIVEVLKTYGAIDQDALARAFARRFAAEPYRGYGSGAIRLLEELVAGVDWRLVSPRLFGGGSYGNGSAMRVAPLGGYFADDLNRAAHEAQRSAVVTHAHLEGQAGAMAVAVAAGIAANRPFPRGSDFLREVIPFVPETVTRDRLEKAVSIPSDDLYSATMQLGISSEMSAQDTVPFCLWSAAHHLDEYEAALWWTVRSMADRDTACAIVGGIVALSAPQIPPLWLERREALTR